MRGIILGVMLRLRREARGHFFSAAEIARQCSLYSWHSIYDVEQIANELLTMTCLAYNNAPGTKHGWRYK